MKDIVYISETTINANHAGNKARADIEKIFEAEFGYSEYGYKYRVFKNLSAKIRYVLDIGIQRQLLRLFRLQGKKLFIQYPFGGNFILHSILNRAVGRNKTVLVIHDLCSMREAEMEVAQEIAFLNSIHACIVHNQHMADFLAAHGIAVPMVILECFDYLRDNDNHLVRDFAEKIVFAGNLDKSIFIQDIGQLQGDFYLYGPNERDFSAINNINYCGSYSPEIIAEKLHGSFGLIWDGDSIETCSGVYGEYTKYNNPHKLSLYIASCLPVIVWEEAAIADFVRKENIGFCVRNLHEIHAKIADMDEADYQTYLSNISSLKKKVISGSFFKSAMDKALAML